MHSTRPAAGTHRTHPLDPFTQMPHAQYTACCWYSLDPTTGPLHSPCCWHSPDPFTHPAAGTHRTPPPDAFTHPAAGTHRTPSLTLLLALGDSSRTPQKPSRGQTASPRVDTGSYRYLPLTTGLLASRSMTTWGQMSMCILYIL